MRQHRPVRFAWLLIVLLIAAPSYGFDRIVIFGDSLSDTGNANLGFNLPPPYFNNRISNGPVAVDVLAGHYGLDANTAGQLSSGNGDNFAVSGGNAAGTSPQDLGAQITAFRTRNPLGFQKNTLVVIIIGGNDLRDAKNFSNASTRSQLVQQAVDAISSSLLVLNQIGAKHVLISNAPDISRIPETLSIAAATPEVISRARGVTLQFNGLLAERIAQIASGFSGVIQQFNLYATFNTVLNQPANFGFTVNDRACFDPRRFRLNPVCDFNRFVFFDSIHPTARTHSILGNALINSAKSIQNTQGGRTAGALMLLLE